MNLGDFTTGQTVDLYFTSISSGVPTALSGAGVSIYKDNSVTQSTEGVTLTSTFDNIVGMNQLSVAMTNAFYAAGSKYTAMLSSGSVGGTTAAGYVLGSWSIRYGTVDAIADETTGLSTDVDDLITSTTALMAGTTGVQTDLDTLTTDVEQLTSASSRLEADSTSNLAALTSLTSSVETLTTATTLIQQESTATAAVVDTISTGTWDTVVAELTTAMNATPTVKDILSFQHMAGWNQRITTGTSGFDLIYNDAGTQAFQSAVTSPTTDSFQRAQWTT
jgi:hypothetical protein